MVPMSLLLMLRVVGAGGGALEMHGSVYMLLGQTIDHRPRGVTVSTLDPESSDRGSNPRETSLGGTLLHGMCVENMCGRKVLCVSIMHMMWEASTSLAAALCGVASV